jgi:hypothetical protein
MDWRRFQVFQIADFMRWEAGFVKSVRPELIRTTNLDGPTNNWYAIRCADLEAYSRAMDAVGIDIYPTPWSDRAFVPYAVDQLIGVAAGRRAHVLECEVFSAKAAEWKKLSEAQRADLLRSELWTMFGHGADGVLMWGFSRGDAFSVTDGEWNSRVLACRDIAGQQRMLGLGAFQRVASEVAICLDPDAYIRGGALDGGNLGAGSALDAEFHGIHAALAAAGFQSDVITDGAAGLHPGRCDGSSAGRGRATHRGRGDGGHTCGSHSPVSRRKRLTPCGTTLARISHCCGA